ncbi:Ras-related protein Rab-44 [Fukomys damarensis]|uniref:Ras-related protein Rab-44 n=1 Tax=Fukomys damarensis TaxID=885580 RepID=A0A091D8Z9_FUKDA|nr:Ras-related protein Rab-44 [Fukomys damarensis]
MHRKGRKLGSSRRRQMREPADGQDALGNPGPESWSSEAEAELQTFFQDCGAKDRGFVTREDLAEAKFRFLGSEEEPQMIFDWLDAERSGHLSLEEFSSGLKNIFGSSLSTHGLRRWRPLPSQRVSMASGFPALEEVSAEERAAFLALAGQLGTGHLLPEQTEIWQLWGKLRQEEPQLAGDLEGFLAKMRSRLQEVQADREALERRLQKRDSDHRREVQRLYEELEHQVHREKQQLQAQVQPGDPRSSCTPGQNSSAVGPAAQAPPPQSDSRGLALSAQVQDALAAKDREVQRLVQGQSELEAQLHSLSDTHREATSENLQLREAGRDLAEQLEEVRGQLQVTRGRLNAARGRVSWQVEEEARQVLQISISELHTQPSGQEPPSQPGPDGAPQSPAGEPPSNQDRKGEDAGGQDPRPEPPAAPQAGFPWGLSGGHGSLVAAALRVLVPVEDSGSHPSPQAPAGVSEQLQSTEHMAPGTGPVLAKPLRQTEALLAEGAKPGLGSLGTVVPTQGLEPVGQAPAGGPELSQPSLVGQDGQPGGLREACVRALGPDGLPVCPFHSLEEEPWGGQGEAVGLVGQDPSYEQAAPQEGFPQAAPPQGPSSVWPPPGETPPVELSAPLRAQETTQTLPTLTEPKAPPGPQPKAAQAEREPGPAPPREPRAESQPLAPDKHTPQPHPAGTREPQANPDYLFHVIFLGDSNVGKTSFLHLLHWNAFATGLAATVGVDFRVKTLLVDNKCFVLQLWDTAGQERYHSVTRQLLRKADAAVLMYDVTSRESFAHVHYWLSCLQDEGAEGVVLLLLGNKMDCEEERQVPTEAGQQLAQELGVSFGECSAVLGHNILEPMVNLAR